MFFKKKEVKQKEFSVPLQVFAFRNHMWVMTPDGIGIVFKVGVETEVHLVDTAGVTITARTYPVNLLRQAKFTEIPSPRRRALSKEKAASMGYV